ncbi:pyruvate dehydrogenase (acetyl-transferring) E1 component subunit alpha [Pasteuria penetrans]|uniref:pyruvate dehydrogenase (acetyl-transferring) E1 component subunit alpha n=1 Tax=Pasteuria penetrans TaxID=86005 RepID=UPI000FBDD81E|nr:pyruvate dehydrogenase (acetyl-transferring) E1 component subunit alpha [Pasteuria penetrans]
MGEQERGVNGGAQAAAYVHLAPIQPWAILDREGQIAKSASLPPDLSREDLRALMYRMVFVRVWDDRAVALARQGRLGFYAPVAGQEATMVASQYALQKQDWILPGYRDLPQMYFHGYPMYQLFLWSRGHQHGGEVCEDVSVMMPQIIIGAQYVQAVGVAMGIKKHKETDRVVVTYTGDGGTSQGDFYEALNFAGVYCLPIIFVVQNNRYAISTPVAKQTAAQTLAQKGIAAGIACMQVDGMDALAVYQVVQDARNRALAGQGPTLIEALNYRLGPHSMSGDDPGRYRLEEEQTSYAASEPLERLRKYLIAGNLWSQADEERVVSHAQQVLEDAVREADSYPAMEMKQLFETMYSGPRDSLLQQLDWFDRGGG